jgi:hypothetical protein
MQSSKSLHFEAAPIEERRSENRHRTVLRVAVIESGGRSQLCTVRNVSETGLKAKLFRKLAAGEEIRIRLREDEWLPGCVVWCQDGFAGIKFSQALDRLGLAEAFGLDEQRRPRVPRIKVNGTGSLRIGAIEVSAQIRDISPRGAGIRLERSLQPGPVSLTLRGFGSVAGQVCWTSGTEAGVMFNEVLAIEALATWIAEYGETA